MQDELNRKASIISFSDRQLSELQLELHNTRSEVTCEKTCLQTRILQLESELEEFSRGHREREEGSQYHQRALQEELRKVQRLNEQLKEELARTQEKLRKSENEMLSHYQKGKRREMELENDVKELQKVIGQRKSETVEAKELMRKLRGKLEDTDVLVAENVMLRKQISDIQREVPLEHQNRLNALAQDLRRSQEQNAALNASLQKEMDLREEVEISLKVGEEENKDLSKAIVKLNEEIESFKQKNQSLNSMNESLHQHIEELGDEKSVLAERSQEFQSEVSHLGNEVTTHPVRHFKLIN